MFNGFFGVFSSQKPPYLKESQIFKMGDFCQIHVRDKKLPTVIVFTSVGVRKGKFKPYKSVFEANANLIFVNDVGDNWYLKGIRGVGSGWKSSARAIVEKARSIGNGKVMTLGSSMGAYGAFLYGAFGSADICVGFGTEFALDLPGSRSEKFKPKHVSLRSESLMTYFESSKAKFYLYVGETDETDLYSSLPVLKLKNFNCFSVRGAQHPGIHAFEQQFGLGKFIDMALYNPNSLETFDKKGDILQRADLIRDLWVADSIKRSGNVRAYLDFLVSFKSSYSDNSVYLFKLGEAYCRINEIEKGVATLKKSLELDPLQHRCYNMIGFALKRVEDFEQAKGYFIKAVELSPKDARPHYNLGLLYTDLGQYDLSREHLEAAVRLGPSVRDYTDALFELDSLTGTQEVVEEIAEA